MARAAEPQDAVARADGAAADSADREAALVRVVVERGDLQLQRRGGLTHRRRHVVEDGVEQRLQVVGQLVHAQACTALAGDRVQHRKLELRGVCRQIEEQVRRRLEHPIRPSVLTIDLVDDDDQSQPELERLLEHEPRLRHRPLRRVHDQQCPIRHAQHALDLTPKVGVPRRVDDVQPHLFVRTVIAIRDGCQFAEDRDALFTFEWIACHAVEGELRLAQAGAGKAGLAQHLIDQAGLAVVDVGDHRDITNIGAS